MSAYKDLEFFLEENGTRDWDGYRLKPIFREKCGISKESFRTFHRFIDGKLFFNKKGVKNDLLQIYSMITSKIDLPEIYPKISYTKLRLILLENLNEFIDKYDKRSDKNYKNLLEILKEKEQTKKEKQIHREIEQLFNQDKNRKDISAEFKMWGYNPYHKIKHAFGKKNKFR